MKGICSSWILLLDKKFTTALKHDVSQLGKKRQPWHVHKLQNSYWEKISYFYDDEARKGAAAAATSMLHQCGKYLVDSSHLLVEMHL